MGNEEMMNSVNQRYRELLLEHKSEFFDVLTDVGGCVERLTMSGVLTEEDRNEIVDQESQEDEKEVLVSSLGGKNFNRIKFVIAALGDETNSAAQEVLKLIISTICSEIPDFDQELIKEPPSRTRRAEDCPVLPPITEPAIDKAINAVIAVSTSTMTPQQKESSDYFMLPLARPHPFVQPQEPKESVAQYCVPPLPVPVPVGPGNRAGSKTSESSPKYIDFQIEEPLSNNDNCCCCIL